MTILFFLLFILTPVLSTRPISSQCVSESSLNLSHVRLVDSSLLGDSTHHSVEGCSAHCLVVAPETSHVMVSYFTAWAGVGDQFNCVCGFRGALAKAEYKDPVECRGACPGGARGWSCGNKEKKLLSVYCVLAFCDNSALPEDLCSRPKLQNTHGCIPGHALNRSHVHIIRNFSYSRESDCIWECDQWEGKKQLTLTRRENNCLTCSCASQSAFPISQLVSPSFCKILREKGTEENLYNVNCKNDLTPGNKTSQVSTDHTSDYIACQKSYIGCVYDRLFNKGNAHKIDIHLPPYPEPQLCQKVCSKAFPSSSSVGIRWNNSSTILECWCTETVHPESHFGPEISCNITCPEVGSLFCGGPRSLSLYCVDQDDVCDDGEEMDRAGEQVIDNHIFENVKKIDVIVDFVLVTLAGIAISLLMSVGILCHQNGLNTFTKDGM